MEMYTVCIAPEKEIQNASTQNLIFNLLSGWCVSPDTEVL